MNKRMSEGAAAFPHDAFKLTDAEKACFDRIDAVTINAAEKLVEYNATFLDSILLRMPDILTIWQCRTFQEFLNASTDLRYVFVIEPMLQQPQLAPWVQAYPHLRALATVLIRETVKGGHAHHILNNVGEGRWRRARNVQALTGRLPANTPVTTPFEAAPAITEARRHDMVEALDVFLNIHRVRFPDMQQQMAIHMRLALKNIQSVAMTLTQLRLDIAFPDPNRHFQLLVRPERIKVSRGHHLLAIMRTALFRTLNGDNATLSIPALTETDKELWNQCQETLRTTILVHKQLNKIIVPHHFDMTMTALREIQAIYKAPTLSHYLLEFAIEQVPDAQFGEVEIRVHRHIPTLLIDGYLALRTAIIATIKLMCSVDESALTIVNPTAVSNTMEELTQDVMRGQSFLEDDDPYQQAFSSGFTFLADMATALHTMAFGGYTPPPTELEQGPEMTDKAQRRLKDASVMQLALGASFHRTLTGEYARGGGKRVSWKKNRKSRRKPRGKRRTRRRRL
jgi:hypothetical protein